MKHLLLIDDELTITKPLARRLEARGFQVSVANNGRVGLEIALAEDPDLVILDVMMPVMDGWQVCRTLREQSTVPILMLTALNDDFDRITGLELGAGDYLSKPFSMNMLVVRVKALLRRVELDRQRYSAQSLRISADPVTIDLAKRLTWLNERLISLRYKEFELLSLLVANAGTPVSRAEIFNKVWGTDWLGDTRTLDVHIRWLREKLEADPSNPQLINTIRNVGYMFTTPSS